MFSARHKRRVGRSQTRSAVGGPRFRRPVFERLELRALLSGVHGYIELGPSDNIALDQPRVAIELIKDLDPDPDANQWASVGPSVFNTFLLDTGANSVLAMATAVADMINPPIPYETEGLFEEVGVGGRHPMDISASYRFDFAGTTGQRHTIENTRILSDADNDFSMFGPWGIVGMPSMANRVTTLDMRGWSGGGTGLDDLYMKTFFDDHVPGDEQHRYALHVDNRLAFDPQDYLVEGEPPIWADIPFLTAIPTHNGLGQEGDFLFDTGAQMSLISSELAMAIGLDSNGDGVLDYRDDAYLGSETIGGVGGTKTVPVFAIDEVRVPVTQLATGQTVELVWTDLQWLVLDIDVGEDKPVLDGVFGSDLLTSGWFHAFFYPGQPDGFIDQLHFDFRDWGLDTGTPQERTGTIYFDLNERVDEVVLPGPGIRLRETARSTEVIKDVTTDTYTIGLETDPEAPVEISLAAEAPLRISADGGETFASNLTVTLSDQTRQTITVMAEDDGLIDGPRIRRITHTVSSDDPDYDELAVRDIEVKVYDNREVVTITADAEGHDVIDSIDVAEGGEEVTYWVQLASPPDAGQLDYWLHIEDPAEQVTVYNPHSMGDELANVWMFDSGNWNIPQPVRLNAVDDNVPEGPHQTQLIHTVLNVSQSEDPIVGQQYFTVYITDNDLGAVLIQESGDGTYLTEGGQTDSYQIALATEPAGPVEITISADSQVEISSDGGATFESTLLTSFSDTTPQTITVRAVDDDIAEGIHTGTITHAITGTVHDPMYPESLRIRDVIAVITDNDVAGVMMTADPQGESAITAVTVEKGGETCYWIRLTSQPNHDVTVLLNSSDPALTAVDDANPANSFVQFTPQNWDTAQAIHVTAGAELTTAEITHSFFSSDPNYQGSALLAVTGQQTIPVVDSVQATPNPVTRPGLLTLTAHLGSGHEGTVTQVEFSHDGQVLGVVADGADGWTLTVATAGWPLGQQTVTARARDDEDAWSEPVTVVVTVENALPVIESLTVSPDLVTCPDPLSLTAHGVSDPDGVVVLVTFYRDEEPLGVVEQGIDGWTLSVETAGWPLGEHTFAARAMDDVGAWSEWATGTATVTSWTNPEDPFDVTGDGVVSALDALTIINRINWHGDGPLPPRTWDNLDEPFFDVSGNRSVIAEDVLLLINHLNSQATGEPEAGGLDESMVQGMGSESWLATTPNSLRQPTGWSPQGAAGEADLRVELLRTVSEEAAELLGRDGQQPAVLRAATRSLDRRHSHSPQPESAWWAQFFDGERLLANRPADRDSLDAFFAALAHTASMQ